MYVASTGGSILAAAGLLIAAVLARPHAAAPPVAPAPAAVPAYDGWRAPCQALLADASRDAASAEGVVFERPHHPAVAEDPDELVFRSANALELEIELAPNHGQLGTDLFLVDDDTRARGGWLAQVYTEHDLTLETREAARGAAFIKIELTSAGRHASRAAIADRLVAAAERCLELASR